MAHLEMHRLALKWAMNRPPTTRYPFRPRQATYCTACAKKCPTDAILVNRVKKTWAIDRLRCISCGYCIEFCTKGWLKLSESHGKPAVTRDRET